MINLGNTKNCQQCDPPQKYLAYDDKLSFFHVKILEKCIYRKSIII